MRASWFAFWAGALLAGCGGDDPGPKGGGGGVPKAPPADDWAEGRAAIDAFGKRDAFEKSTVTEKPLETSTLRAGWVRFLSDCRMFRVDALYKKDHPEAQGAVSTQRTFILRRGDPHPYPLHEQAEMVRFGAAQKVVLRDDEDVKDFADLALAASFAGTTRTRRDDGSWEILVLYSGRPGGNRWLLRLDAGERPASLEDLGYDAKAR